MNSFEDLGLSSDLLKAVKELGFEEPTPIQRLAVPQLLAGRDILGQAQTGTGKTAAFGLPILEKVEAKLKAVQALILCPTRELAIQVAEEISKLGAHKRGVFVLPVYGGQPIDRQIRSLDRNPQIIVGTPGRVLDHLKRGSLKLNKISSLVLDEADEMLDMGFRDDIALILDQTPQDCQRVFFSATMPRAILDLAKEYLNEPEILRIEQKMLTVPTIEQIYYEVRQHQKMDALCRVLDSQAFRKALVFCQTKRGVDEVAAHLLTRGYQSDALHGDLAQSQRDRVMGRFRSGSIEILVATDVAARGLDVDDVDAVINYDIPGDVENYVHRIGRTGRAGRAGRAFTFVTAREHYKLRDIMRYTTAKITLKQLPSLNDVTNIRTGRLLDEVRATMDAGTLERYIRQIEEFLDEGDTSLDMAAALLKLLMQRDFGPEHAQEKDTLVMPAHDKYADKRDKIAVRATALKKPGQGKEKPRHGKGENVPMQRLFVNVGSSRKVAAKDFVGAITGECGIASRNIGAIEIHEQFSYVDVPVAMADEIMAVMNEAQIRGNWVTFEAADSKKKNQVEKKDKGGKKPKK